MNPEPYNIYIQSLAEKWLNGTITPAEEKEFAEWYNRFNDEAELLLDADFANGEADLKKRIHTALEKKLTAETDYINPKKTLFSIAAVKQNWWRYAAAAVFGGLLTAGTYLIFSRPAVNLNNTAAHLPGSDLPPGGNKAVLTLANGSAIVLDSAANGKVAQEGNGQVTKLANGRIAYSPVNAAAATQVLFNKLNTPRGGEYQLGLPDGTQVWLNSASSIRYPTAFTGKERNVEITGEVYFEVAKNAARPFKVKVNNTEVEVLGTHFNINAYADEDNMQTTLLEGSVKISQAATHNSQIIKPGQQAQVALSTSAITVVKEVDVDKVMSWKSGFFEFDNMEIAVIMRQISRWYDIDVLYEGKQPQEKFGGRISKNLPLSKLLNLLQANGIQFRLEGRKLVINS